MTTAIARRSAPVLTLRAITNGQRSSRKVVNSVRAATLRPREGLLAQEPYNGVHGRNRRLGVVFLPVRDRPGVLKLARTTADLARSEAIAAAHAAETIQYRKLDRMV